MKAVPRRSRAQDIPSILSKQLADLSHLNLTGKIEQDDDPVASANGGFCDVYRGTYNGRPVAIKKLRGPHIYRDVDNFFRSFCRELRIWSSIEHPNILPFLGYVLYRGDHFALVSPWMENGTVSNFSRGKSVDEKLKLIKGIASGLSYLHRKGIVHSDLKCDNVLVSSSGEPVLLDFGLSRFIASKTIGNTKNLKGSLAWMAVELLQGPEVFESETQITDGEKSDCGSDTSEDVRLQTTETDVWAFGMTCFELLENRIPYSNLGNEALVIRAILEHRYPSSTLDNSSLLEQLIWKICKKCWRRVPVLRPTMEEIEQELNDIILSGNHVSEAAIPDVSDDVISINPDAIGSGAFADVYEGTWQAEALERKIAIKVLRQKFDHKEKTSLKIFKMSGIAAGIEYLHNDQHVIHGDLSSKNILISDDGEACITDFGLSRLINQDFYLQEGTGQENNDNFLGKIRYLAPELMNSESNSTFETDIYAFGMLSLEITTRLPAFYYLNTAKLVVLAVSLKKERPDRTRYPRLPDRVWDFFSRCWHDDPGIRPVARSLAKSIKSLAPELDQKESGALSTGDIDESNDPGSTLNRNQELRSLDELYIKDIRISDFQIHAGGVHSTIYSGKFLNNANKTVWIKQLSSGLSYLHKNGIIHGELRPSKILISDNGTAVISGYGLTSLFSGSEDSLGTSSTGALDVRYLAPELLQLGRDDEHKSPDERADCWSFAMVAREILSGLIPYHYANAFAVFRCLFLRKIPIYEETPTIPFQVWEILSSCWNFSPEARPSLDWCFSKLDGPGIRSLPAVPRPTSNSSTASDNTVTGPTAISRSGSPGPDRYQPTFPYSGILEDIDAEDERTPRPPNWGNNLPAVSNKEGTCQTSESWYVPDDGAGSSPGYGVLGEPVEWPTSYEAEGPAEERLTALDWLGQSGGTNFSDDNVAAPSDKTERVAGRLPLRDQPQTKFMRKKLASLFKAQAEDTKDSTEDPKKLIEGLKGKVKGWMSTGRGSALPKLSGGSVKARLSMSSRR
ncbi:hypothetical protein M0805_002483 [Coniferiporia weirii]|nr:hypothetical protein M0805_002483 [Coniferiporia weirii]